MTAATHLRPGRGTPPAAFPRTAFPPHEDSRTFWIAFAAAVAIHLALMGMPLPERHAAAETPEEPGVPVLMKPYLPPPPVERPPAPPERLPERSLLPDPRPEAPVPVPEPAPELLVEPPPGIESMPVEAEPPPSPEPRMPGRDGVTHPVLLPETKVRPVYPEIARRSGIEAEVLLQAVVLEDGRVGEVEVLRCTRPGLGFEEAATRAVRQWRYRPAMQAGRPVDVFVSVIVRFELD